MKEKIETEQRNKNMTDPSQDSSVGCISAWYWGGPGLKSWQGQEFFNENIISN